MYTCYTGWSKLILGFLKGRKYSPLGGTFRLHFGVYS